MSWLRPAGHGLGAECGAAFAQATVATAPAFGASTPPGGVPPPAHDPESAATATVAAIGPLRVGQAFGPHYHVIAVLGLGGMGAVYQAWDAELTSRSP